MRRDARRAAAGRGAGRPAWACADEARAAAGSAGRSYPGSARSASSPASHRLPQRLGLQHVQFAMRRRAGRGDRRDEAELRALLEPPLGLRRRPQPAGEADLAEGGEPVLHGHALGGGGDRERDREVGAGLVDADAAGDVHEDVGLAERDAARGARARRRSSRAASGRRRSPTRRGIARSVGATSAWISSRIGRVPSSAHATAAPISPVDGAAEELRRVGHADEPGAGHLEDAELVRRAEAVLRRAQDAVRVVAVALELEHAVDEVLEHARAGDRAVLRHVADEDRRDAGLLRDAQQPRRGLAHLARPSPAPSRARTSRASAPSRSRRRRAARCSSVAQTVSSSVSARISTFSAPPSRAARSFTCATTPRR